MSVIACKLPAGLQIVHGGQTIVLVGANIGEDLENVSRNGLPADNMSRAHGYGLTTLTDAQTEAFTDWVNQVTYKDGKPGGGKLAEPFAALENGSILGPFKTVEEARKEVASLSSAVSTGFEGLDAEAEGVEQDEEADKSTKPRAPAKK